MKYQHYKGGIYEKIGEATHSETGEKLVIYKNSEGQLWARPWDMFFGNVDVDGERVRRFRPIRSEEQ